jgi:hypothetical protein
MKAMESILVMNWQLEVDSEATARAHAVREAGGPELCGCLHCRNFAAARKLAYPAQFANLLDRLGVAQNRESEIWHGAEVEPGLHFYFGWFHFVGRIVTGSESHIGGPLGGQIKLEALSEHFSMGFTRYVDVGVVPESFPSDGVAQLEFSAKVPWVLSETFES